MAGMFDEINELRDLKERIERDARSANGNFSLADAAIISRAISNIVTREKTILTTKAALTEAIGLGALERLVKGMEQVDEDQKLSGVGKVS